MFNIPVVGNSLGEALIALLDRMALFRFDSTENQDDVLAYLDNQGYTDFRECPDHSLAVLRFAERFEYRELWTDAFVHCVGMNDDLILSAEFEVCHCHCVLAFTNMCRSILPEFLKPSLREHIWKWSYVWSEREKVSEPS